MRPLLPVVRGAVRPVTLAALTLAANGVWAQLPGTGAPAVDAPWYVGAAQGIAHDSNVARAPDGEGGAWSSTSLLAGYNQHIGRQRLFGRADVSLNRYFDQSRLNNTSYNLLTGLDWETVQSLSGRLEAGLDNRLIRPALSADGSNDDRNLERTQRVQGTARWGGASLLTLEATGGYARVDQSLATYASQESRTKAGSLGGYWNGGGPLRLGLVGRYESVFSPTALVDGAGNVQSDRVQTRGVEVTASYDDRGAVAVRGRLGHARSSHANPAFDGSDFSGLAGSLAVDVRPTGKLSLTASVARDPSLNALTATQASGAPLPGTGTGIGAGGGSGTGDGGPSGTFQRNVVTTTWSAGADWQATAKITATARLHHARARLVGADGSGGVDTRQLAGLGVRYELNRAVGLGCGFEHERRRVTGTEAASYSANAVGCTVGFIVR